MDFPVCLNLAARRVVVVGGGQIALRKAGSCVEAGAAVTAIAPEFVAGFDGLTLTRVVRLFSPADVEGAFLVFAATDDRAANRQVAQSCRERQILCNAADDPDACDFTLPAVARAGDLTVAVSTSGKGPALAGRVRDDLAALLPEGIDGLVRLLALVRERMDRSGQAFEENGKRMKAFLSERPERLVAAGDLSSLEALVVRHFGERFTLSQLGFHFTGGTP